VALVEVGYLRRELALRCLAGMYVSSTARRRENDPCVAVGSSVYSSSDLAREALLASSRSRVTTLARMEDFGGKMPNDHPRTDANWGALLEPKAAEPRRVPLTQRGEPVHEPLARPKQVSSDLAAMVVEGAWPESFERKRRGSFLGSDEWRVSWEVYKTEDPKPGSKRITNLVRSCHCWDLSATRLHASMGGYQCFVRPRIVPRFGPVYCFAIRQAVPHMSFALDPSRYPSKHPECSCS
jgi:hypothetical protein